MKPDGGRYLFQWGGHEEELTFRTPGLAIEYALSVGVRKNLASCKGSKATSCRVPRLRVFSLRCQNTPELILDLPIETSASEVYFKQTARAGAARASRARNRVCGQTVVQK